MHSSSELSNFHISRLLNPGTTIVTSDSVTSSRFSLFHQSPSQSTLSRSSSEGVLDQPRTALLCTSSVHRPHCVAMFSTAVVVLLLSFCLFTGSAFQTNLTLILNDCCGPTQSHFLRTLTVDSNSSLTINITATDFQSTLVYRQQWNDPFDENVDGVTADPTPGNPAFLTAHGDYQFIQYVQSPLNTTAAQASSSRHKPAPYLSNMMPYPQVDVSGVGLHYVELRFLYYLDLLSMYYAMAFINVEGSSTDFNFFVFTSPDQYSGGVTAARPTYTDRRQLPRDTFPSLTGSKAAVDQMTGLVYVNVILDKGWLWVFDAQKNAVVNEFAYPTNTTDFYKTELTWSNQRQMLYGATFMDNLVLDKIDPVSGTVVRIAEHENVIMDNYDSCQALDDENGWWYFLTNDPDVAPSYGLVWLLYSVNVDTGAIGPTITLNIPYLVLGVSFISPSSLMRESEVGVDQQVKADEMVTAAEMQRAKRRQGEKTKKSRTWSPPAVAREYIWGVNGSVS